jgi:hypothetical protein
MPLPCPPVIMDNVNHERPRLDGPAMHQLANYLAVILGFVELILADTTPDNPRYEDLIEIRNAAVDAARLVGNPPADL